MIEDHSIPFHHSHSHGGPPCARQTQSRIMFPSTLLVFLFHFYAMIVHYFLIDVNNPQQVMNDPRAAIYVIMWLLIVIPFLRGGFTSPGLVDPDWWQTDHPTAKLLRKQWAQRCQAERASKLASARRSRERAVKEPPVGMVNINIDNDDDITPLLNGDDAEFDPFKLEIPNRFKRPQRSHFSREYNANVLRMDHYCVWLNNVIGLRNYKFFFVVIFWMSVGTVYTILLILYDWIAPPEETLTGDARTGWGKASIVTVFIVSLVFSIFCCYHLYMHGWLVSKNLTQLEIMEFYRIREHGEHFGVAWHDTHRFDYFDKFENARHMLGQDWWFWVCPTAPDLIDDGYTFESNMAAVARMREFQQQIQSKREDLWRESGLLK